ncbi:MAG: sigma 54-interacting transcriptional regulator, partial [Myxococcales bacterium]|nr:sigma 54-interacting transcriptional regulator [Myxococcales bacterium]
MSNPSNTLKSVEVRAEGLPRSAPALVLIVESQRPLAGGAAYSLAGLARLTIGRGGDRLLSQGPDARLELPDPKISGRHALLEREAGGWRLRDCGATNGCLVNGVRVDEATLRDCDLLRLGGSFFRFRARQIEGASLASAPALPGLATLVGQHHLQLSRLARVAATPIPVLLRGETGSGKEVVARAIHAASGRGPFVAVNCGAIAPTLLESQLFGHVRGAFSGAIRDEPGFVRAADGGTLFLDEVAELPAPAQATLLRVLQQSEVVPVGATRPIRVDVRVLSATHQPLEAWMGDERFRRDLYARLAGFTHRLPPLRERLDDLGILLAALLSRRPDARPIQLRPEVVQAFLDHAWPLNVRELEQALTAAVALSPDGVIRLEDLPE